MRTARVLGPAVSHARTAVLLERAARPSSSAWWWRPWPTALDVPGAVGGGLHGRACSRCSRTSGSPSGASRCSCSRSGSGRLAVALVLARAGARRPAGRLVPAPPAHRRAERGDRARRPVGGRPARLQRSTASVAPCSAPSTPCSPWPSSTSSTARTGDDRPHRSDQGLAGQAAARQRSKLFCTKGRSLRSSTLRSDSARSWTRSTISRLSPSDARVAPKAGLSLASPAPTGEYVWVITRAGDGELPAVEPIAQVAGRGAVVAEVRRLVAPEGLHQRVDQAVLAELGEDLRHPLVGGEGKSLVHGADRVVHELDRLVHAHRHGAEQPGDPVVDRHGLVLRERERLDVEGHEQPVERERVALLVGRPDGEEAVDVAVAARRCAGAASRCSGP